MRIVFRSDDRDRGRPYAPSIASSLAAPSPEEGQAVPAAPGRTFEMQERTSVDGLVRLTLLGDLDLSVAETLSARLDELKAAGRPVRLDLSQLAFIDSSGLQALLVALTDARWTGWKLEIAPELSHTVERAARITGIAQVLWPEAQPDARPRATKSEIPHQPT